MNAVEIAEAVSELVLKPYDENEFPYLFLEAFGNKSTTIKKLRAGSNNKSDCGGVLQRNNIHIATVSSGEIQSKLLSLRNSKATEKFKSKFILVTDGNIIEAEDINSGEVLVCSYLELSDRFGFFFPIAGITAEKKISENAFDIKATGRLNKLYVQLLNDNEEWGKSAQKDAMNHFMARLIFCFFAEDTDIFGANLSFSGTVEQMSNPDSSNTHIIIGEIFKSMSLPNDSPIKLKMPKWATRFPYVNGGLFDDQIEVPLFSKISRSYLLHIGSLDWTKINPDIFGSMIQAVADLDERRELGMHYTSIPNILKVLNPLILDDLRNKLLESKDNQRKLFNLRNRISRIRFLDPACGSGNFLVIAYKELRKIEMEINEKRGEFNRESEIPLTNFRGIEIRSFSVEIARLSLIITKYQCDVIYLGQREALNMLLPLKEMNWITCGNALRIDWSALFPIKGRDAQKIEDDLFSFENDNASIVFKNDGGETYICGNPPYVGFSSQSDKQKSDLKYLFDGRSKYWKSFDYVMGWFFKAYKYMQNNDSKVAFVSTNSICQGQLVPMFWPLIIKNNISIFFAHKSFKWRNLAAKNAGVIVVILGLTNIVQTKKKIYEISEQGDLTKTEVKNINPYLISADDFYINALSDTPFDRPMMIYGNKATDGGNLILSIDESKIIMDQYPNLQKYLKAYYGSAEFIKASPRVCIWVEDNQKSEAYQIPYLKKKFEAVSEIRSLSTAKETRLASSFGYKFRQIQGSPCKKCIIIPRVSSVSRSYLPIGLLPENVIISDSAFAIYDPPLWSFAVLASKLHLVWVATVCGKLKNDYRYSNTLGWNSFPLPLLTEKNKLDLGLCSENILLARENHFPDSISKLYTSNQMPDDLLNAHKQNDEVLERIYIGRRFKNDSERLEKLFQLYVNSNYKKS